MNIFAATFIVFLSIVSFPFTASAYLMESQEPINVQQKITEKKKQSPGEKLYQQGLEYLAKQKFDKAKKAFEDSLAKEPQLVKSMLGVAEVYFYQNKTKEAGKIIKDAITKVPNNSDIYVAWGRYQYLEKQYEAAEEAFKKALSLNGSSIDALINLGDLYMNVNKKYAEAADIYKQVLALDPKKAGIHYALGMAYQQLGKDKGSIKAEFEEAKRLEPNNPLPVYALVQFHISQKDYPAALGYLDEIITRQPKYLQAYLDRGEIYLATNNLPKAEESYRKALDLNATQPVVLNNLAWIILTRKGDLKEALRLSMKAVELAPQVPEFADTLRQIKAAQ